MQKYEKPCAPQQQSLPSLSVHIHNARKESVNPPINAVLHIHYTLSQRPHKYDPRGYEESISPPLPSAPKTSVATPGGCKGGAGGKWNSVCEISILSPYVTLRNPLQLQHHSKRIPLQRTTTPHLIAASYLPHLFDETQIAQRGEKRASGTPVDLQPFRTLHQAVCSHLFICCCVGRLTHWALSHILS